MICAACRQAEAVVFIKEIVDNKVSQGVLCADCAERVQDSPGAASVLLKLLARAQRADAGPRCPGCQTSFGDFQSSGRLGCRRCYEHFAPALARLLPRIHGGARSHRGKVPKRGA